MLNRRRKSELGGSGRGTGQPNSLFGEILDWMLAPLLFLWPISIIATHNVADNIASQPYDLALAESLRTLSRFVTMEKGLPVVSFPASPRVLFRSDQDDVLYWQVADERGEILAGDADIPRPVFPPGGATDDPLFRDELIQGEEVRVVYQFLHLPQAPPQRWVVLQMAETRNKRADLASEVVTGVLFPQFAIIPLAVVLVWVGLTRGIEPLSRLQSLIRRRRPTDLSPIQPGSVPEEVRPLIVAFNDMMVRLEENLQAQQRFIADAAHQMRTPLTGLKMQTDLALRETDPDQLRRSLAQIAGSTDRAVHLINQLLSLARAESSFEKLYAVEPLELESMVCDVAQDLFPRALAKDIDLGVEITQRGLRIEGNPVLLREMIKNLIDNAIKYTPRGGTVTARTREEDRPVLEVEDTGMGIPEADLERVFERFYRVLGSGVDGSGLGLPIVREIAELHRATVLLVPNPGGKGTLARVVFPRGPRLRPVPTPTPGQTAE
jgi:two-component system sensor histidine kinase TctE